MKNIIKTIQNTAFREGLWKKGDKIVLAVSGGADSVCMLDAMVKIAPKADLKLLIAHVNYGLRGKDSDQDEEFVRRLARKYGLKAEFLKGVFGKGSGENELREARYEFFEKVRRENKFDLIAVAHNADDQVETFLMRIIRGAGLQGLAAMKYKTNKIIRPLPGIFRKEILEYLNKTDRTYRTDRTNLQSLFFRNKVRNKLIPYLEKNFNPQIGKTIFDSVGSIAEDYDFISEFARKEAVKMKEVSVKKILRLHPALQRRIILEKIAEIKADRKDIEAAHIEEILKIVRSTKSKAQIVVFQGLKVARKGDKIVITRIK